MGKITRLLLIPAVSSLLLVSGAHAEQGSQNATLLVDTVRAGGGMGNGLPLQGQTMQQVHASLGAPEQQTPAVGQPPISRWVYDGYTVYFEHERVLHTVQQR